MSKIDVNIEVLDNLHKHMFFLSPLDLDGMNFLHDIEKNEDDLEGSFLIREPVFYLVNSDFGYLFKKSDQSDSYCDVYLVNSDCETAKKIGIADVKNVIDYYEEYHGYDYPDY